MAEVRGGRPSGSEKATVKPKEFTLKNEAGLRNKDLALMKLRAVENWSRPVNFYLKNQKTKQILRRWKVD